MFIFKKIFLLMIAFIATLFLWAVEAHLIIKQPKWLLFIGIIVFDAVWLYGYNKLYKWTFKVFDDWLDATAAERRELIKAKVCNTELPPVPPHPNDYPGYYQNEPHVHISHAVQDKEMCECGRHTEAFCLDYCFE